MAGKVRGTAWRAAAIAACCISVETAPLRAQPFEAVQAPRIEGIRIDGLAEDWGSDGFRVETMAGADGLRWPASNFDPRFRLAWDSQGLLLLFEIADDKAVEIDTLRRGATMDAVEAFVAESVGSANRYQTLVSPGVSREYPRIRTQTNDMRKDPSPGEIAVEAASAKTPDGYTVEMRLPLGCLGLEPRTGLEIGLQIFASDEDGAGLRMRAAWHPNAATATDLSAMRAVRLAEAASPPEQAVVRSSTQPGGLPWIHAIATAELAGQPVKALAGAEIAVQGILKETDGYASAHLLVPLAPEGEPQPELRVFVGDTPAGSLSFAQRIITGTLWIGSEAAERGKAKLRVALAEDSRETLGGAKAAVRLRRIDTGAIVAEDICPLGGAIEVSVPEGIYRAEAAIADAGGRMLWGEGPCLAGPRPLALIGELAAASRAMQAVKGMETYAGWLDYLAGKLERETQGASAPSAKAAALALQLDDWIERILADPAQALAGLRGVQEWAYLSEADGTGQPFTIRIPDTYNPAKRWPLEVNLHGRGGMHGTAWGEKHPMDRFVLQPLGRARAGGYGALSEVDVLEALAYVYSHWSIDLDRVHLTGTSMGGFGTFQIGARRPDLFATARPLCGGGLHVPLGNMLNLPTLALHSRDDRTVPIVYARGAIDALDRLGGMAALDETDGVGHAIGKYTEGAERALDWAMAQSRAPWVDRVRYTALDEFAREAYWATVEEWGPDGRPALIDARLSRGNDLFITLDNASVARIDVAQTAADLKAPMHVFIEQRLAAAFEPPLPRSFFAIRDADGEWRVAPEAPETPKYRLHYPGGAMALFHGEPLMVVWGTGGDKKANRAMKEAADLARRSCRPSWPAPNEPRDGVPIDYTLYGQLPGKPDSEVTAEDQARYNMILLGDATQNAVVAQLAGGLPVSVAERTVRADDGFEWPFEGRAMGLLHYNPRQPQRLIYWIAADTADFYRAETPLMEMQGWSAAGPDFLLVHATERQTVAARRFDSRWRWTAGYAESPTVSDKLCQRKAGVFEFAKMLRRAAAADFSVIGEDWSSTHTLFAKGETRLADIAALEYESSIGVAELTGAEILAAAERLNPRLEKGERSLVLLPTPEPAAIDRERLYRVAMIAWDAGEFAGAMQTDLARFRLSETPLLEAIRRFYDKGD